MIISYNILSNCYYNHDYKFIPVKFLPTADLQWVSVTLLVWILLQITDIFLIILFDK